MEILGDSVLLARLKVLKKIFGKNGIKKNYIEQSYKENKYYIEIKYTDKSAGTRWFHRGKWRYELVHTTSEGHRNIAPFVLFSNFNDCVLNAVLCEDTLRYKIDKELKDRKEQSL